MDANSIAQAVIALLVITSPPDPVKVHLFNSTIGTQMLLGGLEQFFTA